jgi:aryl-alcohol dehydrogenase-like predicted oxidoreductase
MAEAHGLAVAGWSPLGGGLLTFKYRRGEEKALAAGKPKLVDSPAEVVA